MELAPQEQPYIRLFYALALLLRSVEAKEICGTDQEILLTHRSKQISMGNSYALPGGRVELHESMRDAVIREVKEELGIIVKPDNTELIHVLHFKGSNKQLNEECTAFFFKINNWEGRPNNQEPAKHTCIKWFPLNALPEDLLERHRQAITLGLQNTTYSEHNWSKKQQTK